jgi:hypothetical protein
VDWLWLMLWHNRLAAIDPSDSDDWRAAISGWIRGRRTHRDVAVTWVAASPSSGDGDRPAGRSPSRRSPLGGPPAAPLPPVPQPTVHHRAK